MNEQTLRNYLAGLTVLYVEDDRISAMVIRKLLEKFCGTVVGAENGREGVQRFRECAPDLVVTDLMMPIMDGIAMIRAIREEGSKVPVLLLTASLEQAVLVDAINLGVSKFLAKPLRADSLERVILEVARERYLEQIAQESLQKDVELLKYRNRYHSRQQELAQAKEIHINRNQFDRLYLPKPDAGGWLIEMQKRARDIMSGDSCSVLRTGDGKLLMFLADAMGHGLSASVTSMLATAFFNHAVAGCGCTHRGFSHLATATMTFAARNLLDDEVFSGLILELDPDAGTLRFAACGMPPLLLVRHGVVERVIGKNPPVSAFSPPLRLQEVCLDGVQDILLSTDGLGDAETLAGGRFRDLLNEVLTTSGTIAELFAEYLKHCDDANNDDDVTAIRLSRIGGVDGQMYLFSCPGTLAGVEEMQRQILEQLEVAGITHGDRLESFDLAISEALMNAFEHGCLRMGADKKQLMLDDRYDDLIVAATPQEGVSIGATLWIVTCGGRKQVWLEIVDPGSGFDASQRLGKDGVSAPSGRGFVMMQRSVDLVRRSPKGNQLILMQMFETTHEGD